ncbi:MAG TPA: adenine phosphoribosyltransferase [Thermomicrobiales bacterium]|nr:adenine phosphoribosyltransferase [Thermomicrobiales bacterium]
MTDPNRQALGEQLKQHVRDIPDFPHEGILFRDITTLLANGEAFRAAIDGMADGFEDIDKVVIIESRGFILGTPIAYALGAGVVPVRKPGRLPASTIEQAYSLEYGANVLEVHTDAIAQGERVLIVDDLLATGGTVAATIKLVERLGGEVAGITVLAELSELDGREAVGDYPISSLIVY